MLRASSELEGRVVNVKAVVASGDADVAVEHQDLLLAFTEAAVRRDQQRLHEARAALETTIGPEAVVEAAGVVGNFERMNRIADACGIGLGMLEFVAGDVGNELDIGHFNSAANSKPTRGIKRVLMKIMIPVMMRRMAKAAAKVAGTGK